MQSCGSTKHSVFKYEVYVFQIHPAIRAKKAKENVENCWGDLGNEVKQSSDVNNKWLISEYPLIIQSIKNTLTGEVENKDYATVRKYILDLLQYLLLFDALRPKRFF